jgi:hypothetical protein
MNVFKLIMMTTLTVALITGCSSQNTSSNQHIAIGDVEASNKMMKTLPKVEKPYSPEKAIQNGDIVNLHGNYSNMDVWQKFLKNVETKHSDAIRITQYSVEGDPLLYELFFDGRQIDFTFDNSMDAYAGQGKGRQRTFCTEIKKKKFESIGESYILSGCASEEVGNIFHFKG